MFNKKKFRNQEVLKLLPGPVTNLLCDLEQYVLLPNGAVFPEEGGKKKKKRHDNCSLIYRQFTRL